VSASAVLLSLLGTSYVGLQLADKLVTEQMGDASCQDQLVPTLGRNEVAADPVVVRADGVAGHVAVLLGSLSMRVGLAYSITVNFLSRSGGEKTYRRSSNRWRCFCLPSGRGKVRRDKLRSERNIQIVTRRYSRYTCSTRGGKPGCAVEMSIYLRGGLFHHTWRHYL